MYDFEQLAFSFMPYGSLLKTGADDQSLDSGHSILLDAIY